MNIVKNSKKSILCKNRIRSRQKGPLAFFTSTKISRSVQYLVEKNNRFLAHGSERPYRTR
jgi:hypothetical protein